MTLGERFHIQILSPVPYEDMVAEIYVDDVFCGQVSQEGGPSNRIFEFIGMVDGKVDLELFLTAIEHAKTRLSGGAVER